MRKLNKNFLKGCLLLIAIFIILHILLYKNSTEWQWVSEDEDINTYYYYVPNVVHYVLFAINEIQFSHFLGILSVLKNQRPNRIYIHCNCHQLVGEYYNRVLTIARITRTEIIVREIERPTEIYGQPLSKEWLNWHAADITRVRVVKVFGGIYLDRDSYVVKSLDVFRQYPMVLDFERESKQISGHVIIAEEDAEFLNVWLESYRNYYPNEWTYNCAEHPAQELLRRPHLIHRPKLGAFGGYYKDICPLLFQRDDPKWEQHHYVIHLFIRGNQTTLNANMCPIVDNISTFNEQIASQLSVTFGRLAKNVLHFEKRLLQCLTKNTTVPEDSRQLYLCSQHNFLSTN